jgi:hypothetical protein
MLKKTLKIVMMDVYNCILGTYTISRISYLPILPAAPNTKIKQFLIKQMHFSYRLKIKSKICNGMYRRVVEP